MAMRNTKKISILSELNKKYDPEKRYSVVIEWDPTARDGYDFFSPEEITEDEDRIRCIVKFYFRGDGKHNCIVIIDTIDGEDFSDRRRVISHFVTYHAIRYAAQMDLGEILNG